MKVTKMKWMMVLTALCLCVSLMAGCAADRNGTPDEPREPYEPYEPYEPVESLDGEIGGTGVRAPGGAISDAMSAPSGGKYSADADISEEAAPMAPGAPDAVGDMADAAMPDIEGDWYGGYDVPQIDYRPGMLTGSEWNDNDHFADFVDKINAQGNGWYEIANAWDTVATKRVHVRVMNAGEPVKLADVVLYGTDGEVLWQAVSDAEGDAYLFYCVDPEDAGAQPARVSAARGGETVSQDVAASATEVTLELAATNSAPKLDLMFVVDTTGSMGDELEYLKTELKDVVTRAAQDGQMSVRTSVNFYRDEGDEYVVRYFDFRSDVDEAVSLISAQSANGGGDYEEAVHTALDNAVNGHVWDEDAVKLLFIVLDAPPHEQADIIASLSDTVRAAAEQGIRIIPVASSGVNTTCEVLFRSWALLTGGTYTYLTNHSGIGNPHHEPDVEEVTVEALNDMLVRIIGEYCK